MATSIPKWLWYSVLAIVILGIWGTVSAMASQSMSPYMVQIVSTIGLIPVAVVLAFSPKIRSGGRQWQGIVLASGCGVVGGTGNLAMYAALSQGGEASVVLPLTGMFPLVTVVLARSLLREKLNRIQALGIGLAMPAICLFGITPGASVAWSWNMLLAPWLLLSIVTLVLFGLACFMQKLATQYISDELSTICFTIASIPLAGAIALLVPQDWSIALVPGLLAVSVGVCMALGVFAMFAALRWGKASVVASLTALSPVVTVLLAVPLLHEQLTALKLAAIVLALAAAAALSAESASAETDSGTVSEKNLSGRNSTEERIVAGTQSAPLSSRG